MNTPERDHNLNIRVSREEMAKLHRLALDRDVSVSVLLRHFVRDAYVARFGVEPAPGVELRNTRTGKARKERR